MLKKYPRKEFSPSLRVAGNKKCKCEESDRKGPKTWCKKMLTLQPRNHEEDKAMFLHQQYKKEKGFCSSALEVERF